MSLKYEPASAGGALGVRGRQVRRGPAGHGALSLPPSLSLSLSFSLSLARSLARSLSQTHALMSSPPPQYSLSLAGSLQQGTAPGPIDGQRRRRRGVWCAAVSPAWPRPTNRFLTPLGMYVPNLERLSPVGVHIILRPFLESGVNPAPSRCALKHLPTDPRSAIKPSPAAHANHPVCNYGTDPSARLFEVCKTIHQVNADGCGGIYARLSESSRAELAMLDPQFSAVSGNRCARPCSAE